MLSFKYEEGGDLYNYIKDFKKINNQIGGLPEAMCISFAKQLLTGVKNLHEHGFIHRDLKPSNILISKKINNKFCEISNQ